MASFSRALTNALINPGFGQGMFGVGQQAGDILGGARGVRKATAEREEAEAKSLQTGLFDLQQMVAQGAPQSAIDQAGASLAQQGAQMPQLNSAITKGAESAKAKTAESVAAENRKKAMVYANKMGDKWAVGAINSGALTPESYMKDYFIPMKKEEAKAKQTSPKSEGNWSGTTLGTKRDSAGNEYAVMSLKSQGGSGKTVLSPIGNAPKEPVGKTEWFGPRYGETGAELTSREVAEAGGKTDVQEFRKKQATVAAEFPAQIRSVDSLKRAIELLDSVETGGPITTAGNAMEAWAGQTPADKAELALLMGESALTRLKPLFGGVISEGERKAVEDLYAGMSKGNAANVGILKQMLAKIESSIATNQQILQADSPEAYREAVQSMATPKRTVSFNDLP